MKKLFGGLIFIYILSLSIYFLSGKLILTLPKYSFYNVSSLHLSEFQNKNVIKIIYISRTKEVYIFTKEKDFYIVNIKDMKIVHHSTLQIPENIKSIYCDELKCKILTDNSLLKMKINYARGGKRDISINSSKVEEDEDLNKKYFCKFFSRYYQKNEGYLIKLYEKDYRGKCTEKTNFLNLYDIKELAVDDELFYSVDAKKNAIFFNKSGELKQAKTKRAFEFILTLHKISEFVVYLPFLPFLGKQ